jgi:uncharacterized protein YjbI with pentapeptide repeats
MIYIKEDNLEKANFIGANLEKANFVGTNLYKANLDRTYALSGYIYRFPSTCLISQLV